MRNFRTQINNILLEDDYNQEDRNNYQIRNNRERRAPFAMNCENDLMIKLIHDYRELVRDAIKNCIKELFHRGVTFDDVEKRQNINIIADAVVFDAFRRTKKREELEISLNPVLDGFMRPNILRRILGEISKRKITFSNVLNTLDYELGLRPLNNMQPEDILKSPMLRSRPDIKVAMKMYLLKGSFNWVSFKDSEFKDFLNDGTREDLNENAKINCWEAVLYGLMKGGVVERNFLKEIYAGNNENIEMKLKEWFEFPISPIISNDNNKEMFWQKPLSRVSSLIMFDNRTGKGLEHDMISFPYSQKQLLKMMITGIFNEEPTKPKLFSHWCNWTHGSIGSVRKMDFVDAIANTKEIRIVPIQHLVNKSRKANYELNR